METRPTNEQYSHRAGFRIGKPAASRAIYDPGEVQLRIELGYLRHGRQIDAHTTEGFHLERLSRKTIVRFRSQELAASSGVWQTAGSGIASGSFYKNRPRPTGCYARSGLIPAASLGWGTWLAT
jgi:hypothetical protein